MSNSSRFAPTPSAVAVQTRPGIPTSNHFLKEVELAQQALKYAKICTRKHMLQTELSILSAWPSLIVHIWRTMYRASHLAWSPKETINEQSPLWARKEDDISIRDLLEEYYQTLATKTTELSSKVHNGLHTDKESFKAYLVDLLNNWWILARLAFYNSITTYTIPLLSYLIKKQEYLPLVEAWDNMLHHVENWHRKLERRSNSNFAKLLTAEKANNFSIRFTANRFLFTMHNPDLEGEKTVWSWSFPALVYAESFPKRSEVLGKVKSVVESATYNVDDATTAYATALITQDPSLMFLRKPYIVTKLSNWDLWKREQASA